MLIELLLGLVKWKMPMMHTQLWNAQTKEFVIVKLVNVNVLQITMVLLASVLFVLTDVVMLAFASLKISWLLRLEECTVLHGMRKCMLVVYVI